MVKNRKRKTTVDTEFAADLLSEELKAGQLRSNPAKVCALFRLASPDHCNRYASPANK